MADSLRLTVPADAVGLRLDKFLADALPDLSRATLQRLIRNGDIRIDGRAARPSQRVAGGETLVVNVPPPAPLDVAPAPDISLDIVYQDADLLVLNKPAGLVVHPASGHADDTLVNALLAHVPDLAGIGGVQRPGIVHRLDKDTSGLLLVAKNDAAHQALQAQFKDRSVDKLYLALVDGRVSPPRGLIDAPIGRDSRDRKKMAVAITGRPAQTEYRTLETLADMSLVEVRLLTGRTHQIRVHLASIGYPIVGDRLYGRRKTRHAIGRQFLHAWRLAFDLPASGERVTFTAPLPDDLRELLAQLGSAWGVDRE